MKYFCLLNKNKILINALIYFVLIIYVMPALSEEVWLTHITDNAAYVDLRVTNNIAKRQESSKLSHQNRLEKAIQKGEFAFILTKLEELNLPISLAIIPLIESSYTLNAVSKQGAAGLWQIMPATSREFNLAPNDRFRLKPSTELALNYFKKLHREFGNWELAICAYNAGSHRVRSALQKFNQPAQKLDLPKETLFYLEQFKALQQEFGEDLLR